MKTIIHIQKIAGIAGSEKHIIDLLSGINQNKYKLMFLGLVSHQLSFEENAFFKTLDTAGISTNTIRLRWHLDPLCFAQIALYLRKNKVDLIHTHLIHADIYGLISAVLTKIPYRISTRHNDNPFRRKPVLRFFLQYLYRLTQRTIAVSKYLAQFCIEVENSSPERVIAIHHGIKINKSQRGLLKNKGLDIRKKYALSPNSIILLSIGRVIEQKGHIFAIEAVHQLRKSGRDISLVILGKGPLTKPLKKYARDLKLHNNIFFEGWQPDIDVYFRESNFIVHPSLWEGFGIALIEAMGAKKAIVASRVSAIPEIVEDKKSGLLVEPGNVPAIVEAITYLLKNPEKLKRMEQAAYEIAKRSFSLEKMILDTEAVYKSVMESPPRL